MPSSRTQLSSPQDRGVGSHGRARRSNRARTSQASASPAPESQGDPQDKTPASPSPAPESDLSWESQLLTMKIQDLRRPKTTDTRDFWYCSPGKWESLIAELRPANTARRRNFLLQLRRYDQAGRMMETSEGRPAPNPCRWCTRGGGLTVPCRVFVDPKRASMCAFCKIKGKSHCEADVLTRVSETTDVERAVQQIRERLQQQEAVITALREDNELLKDRVMILEDTITSLRAEAAVVPYVCGDVEEGRTLALEASLAQLRAEIHAIAARGSS